MLEDTPDERIAGTDADASAEAGSTWYQRAYFDQLVAEELRRDGAGEASILLVRLPSMSRRAAGALHAFVATQLRITDLAGLLGTGDYAICLPNTARAGSQRVAQRLSTFLEDYAPSVGVATYPEDGADLSQLLDVAQLQFAGARRVRRVA